MKSKTPPRTTVYILLMAESLLVAPWLARLS